MKVDDRVLMKLMCDSLIELHAKLMAIEHPVVHQNGQLVDYPVPDYLVRANRIASRALKKLRECDLA